MLETRAISLNLQKIACIVNDSKENKIYFIYNHTYQNYKI
jgi:hypothetical protein